MGALGHFLETAGIPTTQISLIREHTKAIQPPRALWVPFELGRPLGNPLNIDLQRRVLLAALNLFNAPQGPVLADFVCEPEDATDHETPEYEAESCPVSLGLPAASFNDSEKLMKLFSLEASELRNWYDVGFEKTGRTTIVNFASDAAVRLISDYAATGTTGAASETAGLPFAAALRLAVQDIKAFYFEAIMARPATLPMDGKRFNHWFWTETAAGRVVKAVRQRCLDEADPSLQMTGKMLLVPMDQR